MSRHRYEIHHDAGYYICFTALRALALQQAYEYKHGIPVIIIPMSKKAAWELKWYAYEKGSHPKP